MKEQALPAGPGAQDKEGSPAGPAAERGPAAPERLCRLAASAARWAKRKARPRGRRIPLAAALLLAGLWGLLFARVNRAFPAAQAYAAGPGEPLWCGGDAVTLQGAWLADPAALCRQCGLAHWEWMPERVLICALTVCRGAAQAQGAEGVTGPPAGPEAEDAGAAAGHDLAGVAPLSCWRAASGGWGGAVDAGPLFEALNPGAPLPERLAPGARQTYLVPVELWRAGFSDRHWQALGESEFRLQLSLYPVRRELVFTPGPAPER